ncbi:NACHT domain-containing protein [Tenacibaculum finnmarkense genomovar ulcerans]|uniref:NACHT domain-containing protein n=1 Tax=Tenacibaculum finnmarkense TaxID=2781243 RepID=UPI00187B753D|nr:pentapeptide repeat-containing protein [Tenacibaculum finnmarkense]MBE7635145.1 NACHT domain-containing protein [Tenacibaculum finnmarkense genomovar ulcerans]MCD8431072.1 pentapeptide repeat-containing protein [Tenacibaculum finnmarkense genomovar ulcerans]
MIAILYIFTLTLTYLLIRTTITWYFKAKKGRYSLKSNYLFKYSIGILFTAFCIINPKISTHIINWIIKNINNKYETQYFLLNTNIDLYTIIIYVVFCIAVIFSLIIAFKERNQKAIQKFITRKENLSSEKKELLFPEDSFKESPIFHERLKKYFELKYKKQGLALNTSTKDNLIYGKYNEGFRHYFIIIKYDNNDSNNIISQNKINDISKEIQNLKTKLKDKDDKIEYLYDYFYIIEKGIFESNSILNFYTKTEDDILNELIDFDLYLKSLISKFNNDKIFSAIAKESEKKTLSETFIMPNYSCDNNKQPKVNLEEYVTNWLEKSPVSKHLALLGDYGMGKTSFLKYYANNLAKDILVKNKILRFPVFISLNNTSPRHGGIKKTISAFVAENLGVDYELFEILIHKGKILFLLDAFDEMGFVGTHDDRFKQINEIWKLAFKNNKILLAGRASYFPSEFELKQTLNIISEEEEVIQTQPFCSSVRLELLNEANIKNYISKYYKPERASEFFTWLENSPSILELCKRPSLMHIIREMLPNLHRKDSKEISNPGNALEKYIDYWINRQESKNIQSAFSDDIKKREFIKSFFTHIATQIFMSKQFKISADFIKEELHKSIETYGIKNLSKKYQKEGFENEILAGYFIELENDYFRFVHKSFFEFFVAKEIISLIKNNKFKNKILFEDWSNPIVNFIYDSIPKELKLNNRIPALLLLMQNGFLSKFKNLFARFYLKNSENITGLSILTAIITATFIYFKLVPWSTMTLILLLIPFLVILIILISILFMNIGQLFGTNKNVKFVIKAFKVAFIKKQFGIETNLDIVLPLLKQTSSPHIPLENINFNSQLFKNCNFYRLRNINFNECRFHIPILNSCHLQNVSFTNSKMNNIIFNKCRFTNVRFNDLKLIINETQSNLPNKLKINKAKAPLLYFRDCKLDDATLTNLKIFMSEKKLYIGEAVDGCNEFKNIIKNNVC